MGPRFDRFGRCVRSRLAAAQPTAADAHHRHANGESGSAFASSPTISGSSRIFSACWWITVATSRSCPAKTSAADVLALKPDGVFLSNGPGDPEPSDLCRREYSQAAGARADLWHLPRAPALRAGSRRQDIQAEIRTSRVESSGKESAHARKSKSPRRITASASIPIRSRRAMWKSRT